MKKWKCTVCGYLYEGENPPKQCPVCGASAEKFILLEPDQTKEQENAQYDVRETDIIVVGSGAAALAAAVTARNEGLSVLLLEKAKQIGGTTARSGGGFWIPCNRWQREAGYQDNREDALKYMARYSYPHLFQPDQEFYGIPQREFELLTGYVDHASEMTEYFDQIDALHAMVEINWTGQAQVDYMDHLPENKGVRGRSIYPKDKDGKMGMGGELIDQLSSWAKNHQVVMLTDCEVTKIILDKTNRVSGVTASYQGKEQLFKARQGVIFGSGGYAHNPELMLQFQRGPHFGGCAVPENTGDFIKMAGSIGAQIGNMAGAFRAQSMIEEALKNPGGSSNVFYLIGDSMVLVNKYGQRIVDEKRNYTDRTMVHFAWDPEQAEWTNMLTFMIFDCRTATLWQGFPPFPVQDQEDQMGYLIKADTLTELAEALAKRVEKLKPFTGSFGLDHNFADNLHLTINRFNEYAEAGSDPDFHRGEYAYDREWTTFKPTIQDAEWPDKGVTNYTMHPFAATGPYYGIILAAGTLDTNGGPIINQDAQVLNWNGEPIEGLYGAGNCIASPTANAYWGAGSTIGPAMTFGYLAAKHAAKKQDKIE